VTTLDRAVTILGINATLSLALSFSLVRGLQKGKDVGFDHQAYWRRSVITATATRVIGIWAAAASRDELFLAGLIQDIGMLVLNQAMPGQYRRLIVSAQGDHLKLAELERAEFGADHAAVGAWLLESWNLPEDLRLATSESHVGLGTPEEMKIFSKCVALASCCAAIWTESDTVAATTRAREYSISLFEMSSTRFQRILAEIAHDLPEATANLDIELGDEDFVDRVLDQARGALVELSLQAHRAAREIQLQAHRDELTSLSNRAFLNEILPRQFEAARLMGNLFSILFIDIDNFKAINDTYGHHGGDCVLASVAGLLRLCTRESDIVARYGGDEFVILLPNCGVKVAADLSNRIHTAIGTQLHEVADGIKMPVTISVGCATMSAEHVFSTADALLAAADKCLYVAKSCGRNRVVIFSELSDNTSAACSTD